MHFNYIFLKKGERAKKPQQTGWLDLLLNFGTYVAAIVLCAMYENEQLWKNCRTS